MHVCVMSLTQGKVCARVCDEPNPRKGVCTCVCDEPNPRKGVCTCVS